ncbi:MAG TPA: type VI secretion system protein [Anaeromyxobacter sp.]|nr:type VI secretion system protein [Anaeromyxobacter sp.]
MSPAALARALRALSSLPPDAQLGAAAARLAGRPGGPLGALPVGPEGTLDPERLDGSLLEAICARALGGERGAVFTPAPEARLLAALGLAWAAARRGGPAPAEGAAALLGGRPHPALAAALDGLAVLDPCCGGGALLSAAERLGRAVGARLALRGLDVAPLAVAATCARLELLGARAQVEAADAFAAPWGEPGLLLANPPFLRHERIPPAEKERAARRSGLSRQADLSAHLATLALRHAPVAALVWPRALDTARSAAPLLAQARARGAFRVRLRSRAAGSFAASVDTRLAVWVVGAGEDAPAAEAAVPLADLLDHEVAALLGGGPIPGGRVRLARRRAAPPGAVPLGELCAVRFGLKSGCNAYFHLVPLGGGAYRSPLLGEVELDEADVAPLLATLKEARAPGLATPARVLFRPGRSGPPGAAARRYLALGEERGVHLRPTCAGRSPWWQIAGGRGPAPALYPAKVGARAFGFANEAGLHEDKKWHALFPAELPAWAVALVLSATPVRLGIEEGARQLTGAQAIADVDCRVVAAVPVPRPDAWAPRETELRALWQALRADPVTTDLEAMLARPAQRALDRLVGEAMGLGAREVAEARRALLERIRDRLAHSASIRAAAEG